MKFLLPLALLALLTPSPIYAAAGTAAQELHLQIAQIRPIEQARCVTRRTCGPSGCFSRRVCGGGGCVSRRVCSGGRCSMRRICR
jgi:hypothetical protein